MERAGNPLPAPPCIPLHRSQSKPQAADAPGWDRHASDTKTASSFCQQDPPFLFAITLLLPPQTGRVFLPGVLTRPKPVIAPITQPGVTVC